MQHCQHPLLLQTHAHTSTPAQLYIMLYTHRTHTYPAPSCSRRTFRSSWGSMCQRKLQPCLRRCEGMRYCVRVCVNERERLQSERLTEWERRESVVSGTGCGAILLADLYRLFVMSSGCAASAGEEEEGGGGGGREGWKKRESECLCLTCLNSLLATTQMKHV